MRYGLLFDNSAEEQILSSARSPRLLIETLLPPLQARAIMVAVRLGVFDAMAGGGQTSSELAKAVGLDEEGIGLLLRVLACTPYVEWNEGRYGLSQLGGGMLLSASPSASTATVRMNEVWWDWLGRLDEVVSTGMGLDVHGQLDQPGWAVYQASMLELSRHVAPLITPLVPVRDGAERLLDIGGSHGLYGGLIARAHPPMRSVVLDLPAAVDESRHLARQAGIDDVVTHRAGNALEDELGQDWDVVFLGNVLHHFTAEQCQELLRRVRGALVPEGTIAIWECCQPKPGDPPELFGDGMSLFFRLTSTARVYSPSEYTGWLKGAGYSDIVVHPPLGFLILITARVG